MTGRPSSYTDEMADASRNNLPTPHKVWAWFAMNHPLQDYPAAALRRLAPYLPSEAPQEAVQPPCDVEPGE